jgi:hypothetical protein
MMRFRLLLIKLFFERRLFITNFSMVRTLRTTIHVRLIISIVSGADEGFHIVHFAPLVSIRLYAHDSHEACKETFSNGTNGIHGRLLYQPEPACGDVKAQELLHGGEIGGRDFGLEALFSDGFFIWSGQSLLGSILSHVREVPSEGRGQYGVSRPGD